MAEKMHTLRLTDKELWYLRESFEAAFTDPNSKNEHEISVGEKLDDLLRRSRRSKGGTP